MKKHLILAGLIVVILLSLIYSIRLRFIATSIISEQNLVADIIKSSTAGSGNYGSSISPKNSPFQRLSKYNLFLAPNDGSLTVQTIDPSSGKGGGESDELVFPTVITKSFYTYNKDEYDFVVFLTNIPSPGFDGNSPVKNNIRGIGTPINDASSVYGSKGKLKSAITLYGLKEITIGYSDLLHEVGHQWLAYFSGTNLNLSRDSSHWSQFLDTATRDGGYVYYSPNGGNPFIDNKDGTFSLDSVTPLPLTSNHKFNSMELYLMGLLPASQVTPLILWETDQTQIQSGQMTGTKKIIKVEDIISQVGKRNPSFKDSQKDFGIAFILVPRKGEVFDSVSIENAKRISEDFSKEWNFATKGLSKIK